MALVREIGSDELFDDGVPAAQKPTWIQLMRTGVAGQFEANPSLFDQIVRGFKPENPIPVSSGPLRSDDPALGWIFQVESRGDDGLWGLVSWIETPSTGYAHASPAIMLKAGDQQTGTELGPRIVDVMLTNHGTDIAGRL